VFKKIVTSPLFISAAVLVAAVVAISAING
jgi:hypothetical protein